MKLPDTHAVVLELLEELETELLDELRELPLDALDELDELDETLPCELLEEVETLPVDTLLLLLLDMLDELEETLIELLETDELLDDPVPPTPPEFVDELFPSEAAVPPLQAAIRTLPNPSSRTVLIDAGMLELMLLMVFLLTSILTRSMRLAEVSQVGEYFHV